MTYFGKSNKQKVSLLFEKFRKISCLEIRENHKYFTEMNFLTSDKRFRVHMGSQIHRPELWQRPQNIYEQCQAYSKQSSKKVESAVTWHLQYLWKQDWSDLL